MGSPDVRGPTTPKRHPACPGSSTCKIASCIHNASSSRFSTDEISVDIYKGNGILSAYPTISFTGGWLYQQIDAASDRTHIDRRLNDEAKGSNGTMVYAVQTKVREMSGVILDRMRYWLSAEMPV